MCCMPSGEVPQTIIVWLSWLSHAPRQRQATLGQLPRITRNDGTPIPVLLVDDEPGADEPVDDGVALSVAGD